MSHKFANLIDTQQNQPLKNVKEYVYTKQAYLQIFHKLVIGERVAKRIHRLLPPLGVFEIESQQRDSLAMDAVTKYLVGNLKTAP